MPRYAIALVLFACFAFGLPIYAMQSNGTSSRGVHSCTGECYAQWKAQTGGVLALQASAAQARAEATPAELGRASYAGCIACHGANGEGGIGPQLAGQAAVDISAKLLSYKAGETLGNQSALMWSQAGMLSEQDIANIAAFIETL